MSEVPAVSRNPLSSYVIVNRSRKIFYFFIEKSKKTTSLSPRILQTTPTSPQPTPPLAPHHRYCVSKTPQTSLETPWQQHNNNSNPFSFFLLLNHGSPWQQQISFSKKSLMDPPSPKKTLLFVFIISFSSPTTHKWV